jgi:hypothetical protein
MIATTDSSGWAGCARPILKQFSGEANFYFSQTALYGNLSQRAETGDV